MFSAKHVRVPGDFIERVRDRLPFRAYANRIGGHDTVRKVLIFRSRYRCGIPKPLRTVTTGCCMNTQYCGGKRPFLIARRHAKADMENRSQASEHNRTHSCGWAIALMYVRGEPGYMLTRESAIYGPFESLWDARMRHAILVPAFSGVVSDDSRCRRSSIGSWSQYMRVVTPRRWRTVCSGVLPRPSPA